MAGERDGVGFVATVVLIGVTVGSGLLIAALTTDNGVNLTQLRYGIFCLAAALLIPLFSYELVPRLKAWKMRGERIAGTATTSREIRKGTTIVSGGVVVDRPPVVTIDQAWYGIDGPETFPDVTAAVRRQLKDGRLDIDASHEIIKITDPFPDREKRLDIDWSLDGIRQKKMFFPEGTRAILPPEIKT